MKQKLNKLLVLTLAFASVFLLGCGIVASADEGTDCYLSDDRQAVILTSDMEGYNGTMGYAMYPIGYIIRISSSNGEASVIMETSNGESARSSALTYANIVNEFQIEHGDYGKSLASEFFYGSGGELQLDTILTLWQRGDVFGSAASEFRAQINGYWGYVQEKWDDGANVSSPQIEVAYDEAWWERTTVMSVKFWYWDTKSYAWNYYADYFNRYKTEVYTINPDPMTPEYIRSATAPNIADNWQLAALTCEYTEQSFRHMRDFYKRVLWRTGKPQQPEAINYYVEKVEAHDTVSGDAVEVHVTYRNAHTGYGIQNIPVKVTLSGGGETFEETIAFDTDHSTGCEKVYYLSVGEPGSQVITAEINGGADGSHVVEESDYSDNVATKDVYIDTSSDFSVPWVVIKNADGQPLGWAEPNRALENSNITLIVPWHNQSGNAASGVKAEILLDGEVIWYDYLDFGPYEDLTSTYEVNVGWGLTDRNIEARLNWEQRYEETNPDDNSASETIKRRELIDFSAHDLTVTPTTTNGSEQLTATCTFDNWNAVRGYKQIPVEFIYDGSIVKTEYIDFDPYGTVTVTAHWYSGYSAGNKAVVARVNWQDRQSESNPDDNESNTFNVTVERDTNPLIEFIEPNAPYRAGTEVVSSYRVYNRSNANVTPSEQGQVTITANYVNDGGVRQTIRIPAKSTVIPAYGNNLVYFKWRVPEDAAGATITFTASVSYRIQRAILRWNEWQGYYYEYYYEYFDDSTTHSRSVSPAPYSKTPNPEFSLTAPEGWSTALSTPPRRSSTDTLSWQEWTYNGYGFTRQTYTIGLDRSTDTTLTPDQSAKSAYKASNKWFLRSGYALNLYLRPAVGGNYTGAQVTTVQRASAYFPEFDYADTTSGKYRTLELQNGAFVFEANTDAEDGGRKHFVPLWMQDGDYRVQASFYDLWCPAGMLSYTFSDNALTVGIEGSIYDDWYTTRQ